MKVLILTFVLVLTSCSDHTLKTYKDEVPKIDLRNFFNGDIVGLGIVQNRSGKVIKRFKVDIKASWKENKAILDEQFFYSDGSKSARIWELVDIGVNNYEGRAGDVVGVANGETLGNVFYFDYTLDLPVDDTTYKVHFKDWMFLLDKNTLLARSYMSKWGINLGEVTIVMTKKGEK
jgi:hypothetical protein